MNNDTTSILQVLSNVDWFVYEDVNTCLFREEVEETCYIPLRIDILYVPIFYDNLIFLTHETRRTFYTPQEFIQYINDIYMSKRHGKEDPLLDEDNQPIRFRFPNKPLVYENFDPETPLKIIEALIHTPVYDNNGERRDPFLDYFGRIRFECLEKMETEEGGDEIYFIELSKN